MTFFLTFNAAIAHMDNSFRETFWQNFAAAIDMLRNAVAICPESLWRQDKQFFFLTYHTVIFLDYYLSCPARNFNPALPFSILPQDELPPEAVDDVIPDEHYSQLQMLDYLAGIREKCKNLITATDARRFTEVWIEPQDVDLHGMCPPLVENYTLLEILFYNFRHVQHHLGQLNFILRQKADRAADWVSQAD